MSEGKKQNRQTKKQIAIAAVVASVKKQRPLLLMIFVKLMKVLRTLVRLLLLFIFALAVAILIAVSRIDPNQYKAGIEDAISRFTGREVEISGDIEWRIFSLSPGFNVGRIAIRNAPWGEAPYMFTVENAEVVVSLRDLIMERRAAIETLRLQNPTIHLETSVTGERNWVFVNGGGGGIGVANMETIEVRDANAQFFDARSGNRQELTLQHLLINSAAQDYMNLSLSLLYNYVEYKFDGVGRYSDDDFLVNGVLRFNNAVADIVGRTRMSVSLGQRVFSAQVVLAAPSLSGALLGIFEWERMGEPVRVDADVVFSDRFISLPRVEFTYSNFEFSGDAEISFRRDRPDVRANLRSPLMDIPTIFFPAWEEAYRYRIATNTRRAPREGRVRPEDPRAFRNIPLPVAKLDLANLNLELRFDSIRAMPDMDIYNIHARAILVDGRGVVAPLSFEMAGGRAHGYAIFSNAGDTFNAEVAVVADNAEIGRIIDMTGHTGVFEGGRAKADAKLFSHGRNLEEFMGNLNGHVKAYTTSRMTGHRIERMLGAEDLFSTIVRTFVGRQRADRESRISCVVMNVQIRDGVVVSNRGVAVETDAANFVIDGSIDFSTEAMDVAIINSVREGMRIGNPLTDLIRIEGTMARPNVVLSGDGVMTNITRTALATTLIGVATGGVGLAVVGLGYMTQLWLSNIAQDDNPCLTAFEGSAEARPDEFFLENRELRAGVRGRIDAKRGDLEQVVRDRRRN